MLDLRRLRLLRELARRGTIAAVAEAMAYSPSAVSQQLAALEQRLQRGHALELTDDLRDLLRQTAPTAAISEAETEEALKTPEGAVAIMVMILSRFRESERRFLNSMYRMTSLRDSGDIEGARQQMRDVLAVEIVPQYRRMAEEQLRGLDSPFPES